MVKVKGSKGVVNIEILGIGEVQRKIQGRLKKVLSNLDIAMLRGANFMQNEIQESIIGNRAEPKSVQTGQFANNIDVDKVSEYVFTVGINRVPYVGTKLTTEDIAKFMEYGTSKGIRPRRHFRNSFARNFNKVEKVVKDTIKF